MTELNQKLAELLTSESFTRWINGDASEFEKQQWEVWEQEDPVNSELRANAEIFYQMRLELDPADDLEMQLEILKQRIVKSKQQKNLTLYKKIQTHHNLGGYRVSVAATIVLMLTSVGLLFLFNPTATPEQTKEALFKTAETGSGETSSLKFSDGSLIRLNAKSTLRYNLDQFSSNQVEVWLQGEGYFDIESNPGGEKREFIIHTEDGKIRVLGTKFNVDTRFKKTSVVLEEGRLEVSRNDSQDIGSAGIIMQPGERAVIDDSSSDILLQKVNVGLFTAWVDGEMEFQNTSLKDIFTSIEATYNIKIDVESPELLKRHITGIVQNPDLQVLLSGLQDMLDLQIKQVNKNKFLISHESIQYE